MRDGTNLFSGCCIHEHLDKDAELTVEGTTIQAPFFRYFYRPEGTKSGMHHPDGVLWFRKPDRRHRIVGGKVPLRDIAPTLLDLYGLVAPKWMSGTSLMRTASAPEHVLARTPSSTIAAPTSV